MGDWLEQRLGLRPLFEGSAGHLVPGNASSWWYVFGSATLVCLVMQIATGICLALVYVPSADQAWNSLQYLDFEQPLGWYLRGL
ncbi:MAG: cytochrome B6, partial [Myxococcota bacterium]